MRWRKRSKHLELTATIKLKLLGNNRHDYQGPFLKNTNVKMKLFIVLAGPFDSRRHCYQTCNRKWPWNISCGFWTKKDLGCAEISTILRLMIIYTLWDFLQNVVEFFPRVSPLFFSALSTITENPVLKRLACCKEEFKNDKYFCTLFFWILCAA